jgi:hypothetical protein
VGGQDGVVGFHNGSGHLWVERVVMKQPHYIFGLILQCRPFSRDMRFEHKTVKHIS